MSEIGDRIIAADSMPPRDCCEGAKPRNFGGDGCCPTVTEMPTTQFATGAVRSADRAKQRYDLVSPIGLRRLAETCHEGAVKYGDHNYEKGMPLGDILNHAVSHLYAYLSGDRSEDHLAHAAWNCFSAMHSEELWPHLNGNLRRAGCVPPNVTDEQAACWGKPRE